MGIKAFREDYLEYPRLKAHTKRVLNSDTAVFQALLLYRHRSVSTSALLSSHHQKILEAHADHFQFPSNKIKTKIMGLNYLM